MAPDSPGRLGRSSSITWTTAGGLVCLGLAAGGLLISGFLSTGRNPEPIAMPGIATPVAAGLSEGYLGTIAARMPEWTPTPRPTMTPPPEPPTATPDVPTLCGSWLSPGTVCHWPDPTPLPTPTFPPCETPAAGLTCVYLGTQESQR